MIYIDQSHSALWTLQYYIMINYNNLSQIDSSQIPNLDTSGVTRQTTQMALTIVGFVPILCIYPFFQKFFKILIGYLLSSADCVFQLKPADILKIKKFVRNTFLGCCF